MRKIQDEDGSVTITCDHHDGDQRYVNVDTFDDNHVWFSVSVRGAHASVVMSEEEAQAVIEAIQGAIQRMKVSK